MLSSRPPLEEADILSLILFNQPVNRLGADQRDALGERAVGLASGFVVSPISDTLEHALDIDLFELEAVTEGGGPAITLGEQVGERLFVRFRQTFGAQDTSEFQLEYQLSDFLRLQGSFSEGKGRADRTLIRRVERAASIWWCSSAIEALSRSESPRSAASCCARGDATTRPKPRRSTLRGRLASDVGFVQERSTTTWGVMLARVDLGQLFTLAAANRKRHGGEPLLGDLLLTLGTEAVLALSQAIERFVDALDGFGLHSEQRVLQIFLVKALPQVQHVAQVRALAIRHGLREACRRSRRAVARGMTRTYVANEPRALSWSCQTPRQ